MSHYESMKIAGSGHPPNPHIEPLVPGARQVFGLKDEVWYPAGWLMPQFKDSRQQPKSLAFRLLEDRLDTKN